MDMLCCKIKKPVGNHVFRLYKSQGYSLTELAVTVLVFTIILSGIYVILSTGRSMWKTIDIQIRLRDNVQLAIERASKEIREAGSQGNGIVITQGSTDDDPDSVKFSIPVVCESGTAIVDASGKVGYWRAPLTWGCLDSTCMDADNDCDTVDYRSIVYSVDNSAQFIRQVLDDDDNLVAQNTFAQDITNFQVIGCPDVSELTLTDMAMDTGGVELTSATGGFTASMVNCLLRVVSGAKFVPGVYSVKVYTDTNTVDLDRDATNGEDASAGRGTIGGPVLQLEATATAQSITASANSDIYLRNY